ncbi:protein HOMOLOG OF MAMMALIAN LYST-INTERACTING PROTEIN 5 isoform X2 [Hevea brasiliensis]|uniref:protein HOMOLOG OF MAMMALIAN LYST-INTERACTING PROTEIN 5 isoform X2 n=1 Tax=Hevea brasiliensis TaxID=3981 RepID=UPI0025F11E60|nr:protein HOMOLOG OF MAMMALIAN LYST-INTERACTING PROTEIN 5 isoform X2 [Hevea brasiliensis]
MASDNEPAKLLLPYLQRADELQKHEPLVSYYCRLYAMEKGLQIPQNERTKTTNSLLISLMNQLEKDKKSLKLGPEDNLHLEGFALSVFGKADKQDRAGRADLNTAKTFYAASIFFEILNQFGALQPDLEQKQKYAVWKAADIRKALKEGRKPNPGPPDGDEDLSVPSIAPGGGYDLGPTETSVTSPRPESDYSSRFHDQVNDQHYTSIPPSSQLHEKASCHHLLLTLLLFILPMISNHLLLPVDQKMIHILSHTTINPTHENFTSMHHIIIRIMTHPPTHIPTSSLILVSQRAVSHQSHLTILLIIKAQILPMLHSQLLLAAIHQLPNTLLAAEMGLIQILPLLPLSHTNMTAITSLHLRKLPRHTRLQDLQLEPWHLMMYQLQWTT